MTKKTFLFACLLGLFVPSTRAYNHRNPVNCAVSVEEGETLPLQVKKDEKEMIGKPDKKGIIFILIYVVYLTYIILRNMQVF